jgi:antitoxin HicB
MRTFVYGARFEPGDEGGIVVSFPDVPEAITQGKDVADAAKQAQEALGLALLATPDAGYRCPMQRRARGLVRIAVAPEVAAKIAVLEAFAKSGTASPSSHGVCARTRKRSVAFSIRATSPSSQL